MKSPSPASSDSAGSDTSSTPLAGQLSAAKNTLAQTARNAADSVKSAAHTVTDRAKEEAGRIATEKKETAANRLGDYGAAIHESASRMEDKDPNIAWYTHKAADKLQGIADYMRQTDLSSLRRDCEGVARRHPAAFFGGLFVAGLILGNVVKASRRRMEDSDRDRPQAGDEASSNGSAAPDGERGPEALAAAEREAAGLASPQI